MNRPTLSAGLTDAAPVAAAPALANPDAALLAACAEAHRLDKRMDEISEGIGDLLLSDPIWIRGHELMVPLGARFHGLVEQAARLSATTDAGRRAKAELVLAYLREDNGGDAAIALSLARDVLAVAG